MKNKIIIALVIICLILGIFLSCRHNQTKPTPKPKDTVYETKELKIEKINNTGDLRITTTKNTEVVKNPSATPHKLQVGVTSEPDILGGYTYEFARFGDVSLGVGLTNLFPSISMEYNITPHSAIKVGYSGKPYIGWSSRL